MEKFSEGDCKRQPQETGESNQADSQQLISQGTAEDPTGQVAFDLAMDMRRLLRARGETPGDEPPLCDHCGSWEATHIIADCFLACDKPRCQGALEQKAKEKQ